MTDSEMLRKLAYTVRYGVSGGEIFREVSWWNWVTWAWIENV